VCRLARSLSPPRKPAAKEGKKKDGGELVKGRALTLRASGRGVPPLPPTIYRSKTTTAASSPSSCDVCLAHGPKHPRHGVLCESAAGVCVHTYAPDQSKSYFSQHEIHPSFPFPPAQWRALPFSACLLLSLSRYLLSKSHCENFGLSFARCGARDVDVAVRATYLRQPAACR